MINIRKGTFETNSSSTHSICITKEDTFVRVPEELKVNIKDYEFGWEYEKYRSTDEKFAYLIMGVVAGYSDNFVEISQKLDKLIKTIGQWVKNVHIEGLDIVCYNGSMYYDTYDGYVDHASELEEMVDALLQDDEMLKRYLFSDDSFILTGNDNEDGYQDIKVNYEYDEFYKGN